MLRRKNKIQVTAIGWTLEVVGLLGIILTILFVVAYYSDLPEAIPRHFNFYGEPDGFGGKSILIILSVVTIVVYLMMTTGLRVPQVFNYPVRITDENAERQYSNLALMIRVLKTLIALSFFYLTFAIIQNGLGAMYGLGVWFMPVTVFTLLATVGLFTYRGFKIR